SAAGQSLSPGLRAAGWVGSASVSGAAGAHRHTPEFAQNLTTVAGEPVSVSFTPVLAPMARGILTTASASLVPGIDSDTVRAAYTSRYGPEPFVHLLPEGEWPATAPTVGSNSVQVHG